MQGPSSDSEIGYAGLEYVRLTTSPCESGLREIVQSIIDIHLRKFATKAAR
jgi:hypothetical protein